MPFLFLQQETQKSETFKLVTSLLLTRKIALLLLVLLVQFKHSTYSVSAAPKNIAFAFEENCTIKVTSMTQNHGLCDILVGSKFVETKEEN